MKIGFIGLGNIGNPMAANLIRAGFQLTVHDLAREKAERLIGMGARWADSSREVAASTEVVITSLPGPPEVHAAMKGERGLMAGIRPGSTWIEMSTTDIAQLRRLANELADMGATTLESPVTGGVAYAHQGKVTMFVGGEKDIFEQRRSVFHGIGDKVFYLGPLGSGMTTKLISNMLCFIQHAGLAEGLMIGARYGLDLAALGQALNSSYAASFITDIDLPKIFDGTYDSSFAIRLACKDIKLATGLARELGVPTEVASLVERKLERARTQYGDNKDVLYVAKLMEDAMDTPLRPTKP